MKFESLRLSYSSMAKADFDFPYQLDSDPEVMKFIRRPSAGIEEAREGAGKCFFSGRCRFFKISRSGQKF